MISNTNRYTSLMYHAISEDGGEVLEADKHYSVSVGSFKKQLELLRTLAESLTSIEKLSTEVDTYKSAVGITFDDGHLSNYEYGLPSLLDNGATADFFVNPSNVGKKHYVNWQQLREMSDSGMSIQSHGYTHRYLTDLNEEEVYQELLNSKNEIEDKVGTKVTIYAPSGGRINQKVVKLARKLGYRTICTSRPGRFGKIAQNYDLPRFAIQENTTPEEIEGWIKGDIRVMGKRIVKYQVAKVAKTVLGNSIYEDIRKMAFEILGK